MNKAEKNILFTRTAIAQIGLLIHEGDNETNLHGEYQTSWSVLHNLLDQLNLGSEYNNWQRETFGNFLFSIKFEGTIYSDELWDKVVEWFLREFA